MASLPAKSILDGSSNPTTATMKSALGQLRDYLAGLLGVDGETLDVGGGLKISKTTVASPAASDGNVYSGTYTPTLTNVSNVDSSTAYECQYMRVGDVLTVSGRIIIDPTTTGVSTTVQMSLPVPSGFNLAQQCGGSFGSTSSSDGTNGVIYADINADAAMFKLIPGVASAVSYYFSFTYRVI